SDGVNQLQRAIPAQNPDWVRVDERKKSDIIRFLRSLSEQIRFFNLNNQEQGNWYPFFEHLEQVSSIIVKAATTEKLPATYNNGIKGVNASLIPVANGIL